MQDKQIEQIEKKIGHLLKQKRQQKKYSLADLHHKTSIQTKYLKDIENGNLGHLPHDFYFVKAFVHRYAKEVGVSKLTIDRYLNQIIPNLNDPTYRKDLVAYDVNNQFKHSKRTSLSRHVGHFLYVTGWISVGVILACGAWYILFMNNYQGNPTIDPVDTSTSVSGAPLKRHKKLKPLKFKKLKSNKYPVYQILPRGHKVILHIQSNQKNKLYLRHGKHIDFQTFKNYEYKTHRTHKSIHFMLKTNKKVTVKINHEQRSLK